MLTILFIICGEPYKQCSGVQLSQWTAAGAEGCSAVQTPQCQGLWVLNWRHLGGSQCYAWQCSKGLEVWGIKPVAYILYAYNSKNSGVWWASEHLHCSLEARIISKAFLSATPEPRLLPVLSLVLKPCAFKC